MNNNRKESWVSHVIFVKKHIQLSIRFWKFQILKIIKKDWKNSYEWMIYWKFFFRFFLYREVLKYWSNQTSFNCKWDLVRIKNTFQWNKNAKNLPY